ncbi:site-specific tyrosine recombinase/integron integrase [Desulforamulus ruminis]|uniref:Integrase family protein n=1 Tax=Desulforamulus ruminis (strain ATCC 23193 / DSM 2154 / NCIMB 8452 / DL) TaxID=696281 RepID=F6DQ15_DESRL|nr:site-specific tyrosine recombinase/integron integrase [Desulforamulus ruminis]AEG61959.1 integrase family protein [Desulforamulus ruminis DSM 2154]
MLDELTLKIIQILEGTKDTEILKNDLHELLNQYEIKKIPKGSSPYFMKLLDDFILIKKTEGLSGETLKKYKGVLIDFGIYIQKDVASVTSNNIREWLNAHEGIKLSTMRYYISVLKSFYNYLITEEYILIDPTRKIKTPKLPKRLPKALSLDELEILREGCKSLREKAIVEVFYATGGRLKEIHNMNITDINWQERTIVVIGKGNKERPVFINSRAVFALKKYLSSRQDQEDALFVTEKSPIKRLSPRSIQSVFKKIVKRVNFVKNVHPHVMRHTMATTMINHGARLEDVQGILGHSSPSTTQIYAQVNIHRRKEAYLKTFR